MKKPVDKDILRGKKVHVSAAPKMEPRVKKGRVRSKGKPKQIHKPKKDTK